MRIMVDDPEEEMCRFINVDNTGFGANRCNYYIDYGKHLVPCFKEFTNYIKRCT